MSDNALNKKGVCVRVYVTISVGDGEVGGYSPPSWAEICLIQAIFLKER